METTLNPYTLNPSGLWVRECKRSWELPLGVQGFGKGKEMEAAGCWVCGFRVYRSAYGDNQKIGVP